MLSLSLSMVALAAIFVFPATAAAEMGPLPAWTGGLKKQAIIDFVTKATEPGSGDRVAQATGDKSDRSKTADVGR